MEHRDRHARGGSLEPGIFSSIAVDADNESLLILYAYTLSAMPTSGDGQPVPILNFR